MSITAIIVVYAVTWFMVLFCVLPVRFESQADRGQVMPGTPASAPEDAMIGKKARITTLIATPLAAAICGVILSGWITVDNMDVFGLMSGR